MVKKGPFCSHHYQYTQGYFFCTKCGHRRYATHAKRRKTRTIVITSIVFVLVAGSLWFYSNRLIDFTSQVPNTAKELASNIQVPTQEEISKTISDSKISKSIEETTQQAQESIAKSMNTDEKESLTALEIHRLVNVERQDRGLSALGYDERLASVAKSHSQDMVSRGFFSHDTPDGLDPTDRANQAGYSCRYNVGNLIYDGIAENIFKIQGSSITFWDSPESIAKTVVDGWMDSPGHRQNILTSHYRNEGIGVEITSFNVYVTQNFC